MYGLLVKATGELARLRCESNGRDRYACGEESCRLTDDEWCEEFKVKTLKDIQRVLLDNPEWYNSSRERPGWGEWDRDDLQPVEIIVTYKPVEVVVPLDLNKAHFFDNARDTVRKMAEKYAGRDLSPAAKRFTIRPIVVPEGMTRAQIEAHVGRDIHLSHSYYKLHAVCDVPEEYQDFIEQGKEGVYLITSDDAEIYNAY